MNKQFQALPIDDQHAIAAYPLVFMHDASITTGQWRQFVRRHSRSSPRTGLTAIRDRRGVIHALFSYRIDNDLRVRKRLSISDLIVAHLAGSQIDDAVARVIGDVAQQFGCQTVTIERPFVRPQARSPGCPTTAALRRSNWRIN